MFTLPKRITDIEMCDTYLKDDKLGYTLFKTDNRFWIVS